MKRLNIFFLVGLLFSACDDRSIETDILIDFEVSVSSSYSQTVINEEVPININILTDVSQDIRDKKRLNIEWKVLPEGAASIIKENKILSNGSIYEKESAVYFKGIREGIVKVAFTLTDSYGISKSDTLAIEVFKDIIFTRFSIDVEEIDSEIYNTSSGNFKLIISSESNQIDESIKFDISKVNLSGNGDIKNNDEFEDLRGLSFGEHIISYSPNGADVNQSHRLRLIVESSEDITVNKEFSLYIKENKVPIIKCSASHLARRLPSNVNLNYDMEFDSYSVFDLAGSSDPDGNRILKYWIEGSEKTTVESKIEVFDGVFYYYPNYSPKETVASSRVFKPNDKLVIMAEDEYGAVGSLTVFIPQYPDSEPYNWAPITD